MSALVVFTKNQFLSKRLFSNGQFRGEFSLAAIKSCRMTIMAGGVDDNEDDEAVDVGMVGEVACVFKVRFRFQQSGNIFFCSSAISFARCEYCSRSSWGNDFHASPSKTLMALQSENKNRLKFVMVGRGDLVVSVLAFYSNDQSSIPTKV